MAISCSPADLIQATACLKCIPRGMQREVMIYLLAQLAGVPADAGSLINAAACLKCIPTGMQDEVITYLLCQLAGGVTPAVDCAMITGDGAPTGVTTPQFTGQLYYDSTGAAYYRSTGLTSADWTAIGGAAPAGVVFTSPLSQGIDTYGTTTITSWSFPNLTDVQFYFNIAAQADMTSLDAPLLATVTNGTMFFTDNVKMPSYSFPSLTSITGGQINISGNTLLTSISLPVLVTTDMGVTISNNAALTTWNAPLWVPTDGKFYAMAGNAFSAASVEQILRRMVLAGVTTANIILNGGTSAGTASLNAQGQADVVTLGAQLSINP